MTPDAPRSSTRDAVTIYARVEWVDTDAAGHHHNSAIMRWVEAAEAKMMRAAGLPEYFSCAPRVHQTIDFRSKLTFEQTVRTRLWIERIGASSLSFGFDTSGQLPSADGDWRTAAVGRLVTAHVPIDATNAVPWPTQWRAALAPFCADGEGNSSRPPTNERSGSPR